MPPQVVVVNPKRIEAKPPAAFIDHARANPDKINYASAGAGDDDHLAGELFKIMTKTRITHVPYRGSRPGDAGSRRRAMWM